MNNHFLLYLFYGLIAGFSEFTPISASAHQALFPLILKFNSHQPMLQLFVHGGALGALIFLCRERFSHLYGELQLVSLPHSKRMRPPDVKAVYDVRLAIVAVVPGLLGALLSYVPGKLGVSLPLLGLLLIATATATYLPDYLPSGNRTTTAMTAFDSVLFGLCAACSVIPGLSRMGSILSMGFFRKCQREYMLDMALLILLPLLAGSMVVDVFALIFAGFAGLSMKVLLGCVLAGAASFGGSVGAILTMRYLAVKTGFSGFAFYSWGLGLFSFILYLMV